MSLNHHWLLIPITITITILSNKGCLVVPCHFPTCGTAIAHGIHCYSSQSNLRIDILPVTKQSRAMHSSPSSELTTSYYTTRYTSAISYTHITASPPSFPRVSSRYVLTYLLYVLAMERNAWCIPPSRVQRFGASSEQPCCASSVLVVWTGLCLEVLE